MPHTIIPPVNGKKVGHFAAGAYLMLLLTIIFPATALANGPTGAEPCADCHQAETFAWQNSPHALAAAAEAVVPGATCQDCHGPYIEDHPQAGVMQLTVDSVVCQQCHATTFAQWQSSTHAAVGVQCIGCHMSHSQDFRLTDNTLCGACHRQAQAQYQGTPHGLQDVGCTDCHLEPAGEAAVAMVANTDLPLSLSPHRQNNRNIPAPRHDFTQVAPENCLTCHQLDLHQTQSDCGCPRCMAADKLETVADSVPALTAKLEAAQQTNRSVQYMAPISLGLGLGIGGMLGIMFMLVCGAINRYRGEQS